MTGTGITQTAGILVGTVGVNASGGAAGNMPGDGFSQIMSRTTKDTAGQMQSSQQNSQTAAARTPVKVDRSSVKDAGNQTAEKTTEQADIAAETVENPEEAVEEAVSEVKDAIEEELGITEEELETIMSELGLTQMDLLQPDHVRDIVMAVAGETDELSILTNETLYQNVQALTETVENIVDGLQAELGVDDAAFADILQQMEPDVTKQEVELTGVSQEAGVPVLVSGEKAVTEDLETQEGDETGQVNLNHPTENTGEAKETVPVEIRPQERNSGREKETGTGQDSGSQFLQGWSRTGVETLQEGPAVEQVEIPFEAAQAREVMDQVTEYMKAEVKPDMTELELRLHPETLGTLRIHLTAREGVVTAQFTAENEAVKTVLEAQAAQLKENLNEQGVKVEAVEVTIASHAFDRNFAENGGDNPQYEEPKKRGTRRIQLDGDVSLDEMELSEEERIAAEMMEQNGNTVDYMA